MEKSLFFKGADGTEYSVYTIKNKNGMEARITDLGANLLSLLVPSKDGAKVDVVLGLDRPEDYLKNKDYLGCVVARVANRIGGASFTLNGKRYELEKNDGNNNLHSGFHSLVERLYDATEISPASIRFSYDSPDGDMGFPGRMQFSVTYTLLDDNSIAFDYEALSDQDTLFNPTTHSYFNLAGHDNGSILSHELIINSDSVTYANDDSIPDGTIREVSGTPMDFRTAKTIGKDIDADYDLIRFGKGYDHNFILKKDPASITGKYDVNGLKLSYGGCLIEPATGRKMSFYTDLPGVQLYTSNFFDGGSVGKGGVPYNKNAAVALETQYYPNAINIESFPQPVIKADVRTYSRTVYHFDEF